MTTINNQDDLLETFRNNPARREAVRAQILGDDPLQLPVKFDTFVQEFEAFAREQGSRLENVENLVREQNVGPPTSRSARAASRTTWPPSRETSPRPRAIQDAPGITSDMGLEFVRTLSARDLSDMAGSSLPRDTHPGTT